MAPILTIFISVRVLCVQCGKCWRYWGVTRSGTIVQVKRSLGFFLKEIRDIFIKFIREGHSAKLRNRMDTIFTAKDFGRYMRWLSADDLYEMIMFLIMYEVI